MPHPHDALIQAHLDGELTPAHARELDLHLAECESCRVAADELAQLGMGLSELALELDSTAPTEWRRATPMPPELRSAVQRAERRRWERPRPGRPHTAAPPSPPPPTRLLRATRAPASPPPTSRLSPWKWAAAALLMVTGAASAAMVAAPLLPGSRHTPAAPVAVGPPPAVAMAIRPAGAIAVAPAHDEMTVSLSDALAGSRLFVTVTDQAEVTVSVRTDSTSAEPARFRTGDLNIAVTLPRAVSIVDVELPTALRSARVVMGGRVMATVVDGRVVPLDATAEGIPLVPSP